MGPIGKYQMLQFSKTRELIIDVVEQGLVKHHVTVVLELDVILERQFLRTYIEKQGVDLSITNWMANCIAQAVSENPQVRALRRGGILPELVRGLAGSSARVLGRQYITSVSIPAAAPDASDSHSGVVADHVGTVCRGMATRLVEVALRECDPIHDSAYDYKCAGGAAGTGVEEWEPRKICQER